MCRMRLGKYELHLENQNNMQPAYRLHVAPSVVISIEKHLSIPGVDALHAGLM